MHIAHLALVDFRSYERAEVALEPGVTTFLGPNGQGKTNLVEAVGYLTTLSSHRVATDAPLVRAGATQAVIRAQVAREGRTTLVEVELTPGRANRARINRSPVPRARDVLGLVRSVLFAPEDLALVRGEPAERRGFLDRLLVVTAPRYAGVRADYERVLRQRNTLLRTAVQARRSSRGADLRTLDVWDEHLATAGAELLAGRLDLVANLAPLVEKAYAEVSRSQAAAGLAYRGPGGVDGPARPAALAEVLRAEIARSRAQEVERGVSLVGPHRDDLLLSLGELPARGYASHGESWSFALALRLASYELLRGGGDEPVLILDDVFAELDEDRRSRLAAVVRSAHQALITAAVPGDVPDALSGARLEVHRGSLRRTA